MFWYNYHFVAVFSIQSNLFFKDENPSNQEKSALGDLFVSALSLRKTTTTTVSSTTTTTTMPSIRIPNATPNSYNNRPISSRSGRAGTSTTFTYAKVWNSYITVSFS